MEPLVKKLTSRKFLGTVIVLVTIFLNAAGITDLESSELFALSATVTAFVFGESVLDRERIKAAQLNNLQRAEAQVESVVAQANEMLASKEKLIASLTASAADGDDAPDEE